MYLYIHIINKQYTYIYYVNKLILDAINHLTALTLLYYVVVFNNTLPLLFSLMTEWIQGLFVFMNKRYEGMFMLF